MSRETKEALDEVRDLLRHQVAGGDPSEIVARSILAFRGQLLRRKLGTQAPKGKVRTTRPGSRHVPAAVRSAVWNRDGGRCAFVAPDGRRCAETGGIEFHHIDPYALGGEPTLENISLRCRAHNAYEGEVWFGARERPSNSFRNELGSGSIRGVGA